MPEFNIQSLTFKPEEKSVVKEKLEVIDVTNGSSTAERYKSRLVYKEQVNDKNLPVGNENSKGVSTRNQLDIWYDNLFYGKKDFANRLITVVFNNQNFKTISGTNLSALNFVADAVNNFLVQFNEDRATHPQSRLNNIKIVKAYSPQQNYDIYFRSLYERFFNDVLNDIKYTNKIKNINDFTKLFYLWALNTNDPITETGFYKSQKYDLYNTGFAVDFSVINSDKDKELILNDPRFEALNYVAKINGLKIDPNYPVRLIADLKSEALLQSYAQNYFPNAGLFELPELVYKNYFIRRNFYASSEALISDFLGKIIKIYNLFIDRYKYRSDFSTSGNLSQSFLKKFETNKIKREKGNLSAFFEPNQNGDLIIKSEAVKTYIQFRAKEEDIKLNKGELKFLTNNISNIVKLDGGTVYVQNSQFNEEKFLIQSQAVNYLENFLFTKNNKDKNNTRDFIFFWNRGREYVKNFTTFSESEALFSYLLAALDAKRIKCIGVHQMESGLFMPCKSHEEYLRLTGGY